MQAEPSKSALVIREKNHVQIVFHLKMTEEFNKAIMNAIEYEVKRQCDEFDSQIYRQASQLGLISTEYKIKQFLFSDQMLTIEIDRGKKWDYHSLKRKWEANLKRWEAALPQSKTDEVPF